MLKWTIGADEVGTGPLAGPVTVGAVLVGFGQRPVEGVTDSKALSAARRRELSAKLVAHDQVKHVIVSRTAKEINEAGMTACLRQCYTEAIHALLAQVPDGDGVEVLIDGSGTGGPTLKGQVQPRYIVKGDASEWSIGAASILAKVSRDTQMLEFAKTHPAYGFAQHMGYGTPGHIAALKAFGPIEDLHRTKFCASVLRNQARKEGAALHDADSDFIAELFG